MEGINFLLQLMSLTTLLQDRESEPRPKNCFEIQHNFPTLVQNRSDSDPKVIYTIYPEGEEPVRVLCDFEDDGGGWTVIHSRPKGDDTNFKRQHVEYEHGFGDLQKGFWLGLKGITALTKEGDQEMKYHAGITIPHTVNGRFVRWVDRDNGQSYNTFRVQGPEDNYRLEIAPIRSDGEGDMFGRSNGRPFSTPDRDFTQDETGVPTVTTCTGRGVGGWWFGRKLCEFTTEGTLNGDSYNGKLFFPGCCWRPVQWTMIKIRTKSQPTRTN